MEHRWRSWNGLSFIDVCANPGCGWRRRRNLLSPGWSYRETGKPNDTAVEQSPPCDGIPINVPGKDLDDVKTLWSTRERARVRGAEG